jgi:hypothetical protein
MVPGARGARWRGWLLAGVLVCVTTGVPARGQDAAREAAFTRVRAGDRHAAALLRLYQRIGGGDRHGDSAESWKAQQIGTKVLYELRRTR